MLSLSPKNLQSLEYMDNWLARKLIFWKERLAMIVGTVEMDDEMNIDINEDDWNM